MELYIEPIKLNRNPLTGRFLKGSIPHNKGKKITDYMDICKVEKVKRVGIKNLRPNHNIGGWNAKKVVAVKDGLFSVFDSSRQAGKTLGIEPRNIQYCCNKKRKTAGGLQWFWEEDNEWISLIQK